MAVDSGQECDDVALEMWIDISKPPVWFGLPASWTLRPGQISSTWSGTAWPKDTQLDFEFDMSALRVDGSDSPLVD